MKNSPESAWFKEFYFLYKGIDKKHGSYLKTIT